MTETKQQFWEAIERMPDWRKAKLAQALLEIARLPVRKPAEILKPSTPVVVIPEKKAA